jgi:hypothetical protein
MLPGGLRHISDAFLSPALDLAHVRETFKSVKKQSAETQVVVSRGCLLSCENNPLSDLGVVAGSGQP